MTAYNNRNLDFLNLFWFFESFRFRAIALLYSLRSSWGLALTAEANFYLELLLKDATDTEERLAEEGDFTVLNEFLN